MTEVLAPTGTREGRVCSYSTTGRLRDACGEVGSQAPARPRASRARPEEFPSASVTNALPQDRHRILVEPRKHYFLPNQGWGRVRVEEYRPYCGRFPGVLLAPSATGGRGDPADGREGIARSTGPTPADRRARPRLILTSCRASRKNPKGPTACHRRAARSARWPPLAAANTGCDFSRDG